jgi:hypothetical protein
MSKTLNNQQRRVLSKLYEKQFNAKEQELRQKRSEDFREVQNKLNATINDKDFKAYVKAKKTADELEKVLKVRYDGGEISFSSGGYQSGPTLEYKTGGYRCVSTHTKLEKHEQQTRETMEKVEIAAQDAQTRIYGLDVTFEEIKKEIDSLLKGL